MNLEDIFSAMLEYNGDRPKVCKALGISMSTLYRLFNQYRMHEIIERCGWKKQPGPPHGKRSATNTVIRNLIQKAIKAGAKDVHSITLGVYGDDTPELRERVFSVLGSMRIEDIGLSQAAE